MKTVCIISIALLFVTWNAHAQYTFTLYNTTNTQMPSNDINDMDVDGNNVKYFANAGGFIRFDGATWTVFDTLNSNLPGLPVYAVSVNPVDNSVWVISDNNDPDLGITLSRFDGSSFTQHLTPSCTIWDPAVSSPIDADPTGAVWANRDEYYTCHNIVRFDGSSFTDLPFPDGNSNYWNNHFPNSIEALSSNEAWVGTTSGLLHYDAGTWTYYDNVNSDLPDEYISCVRHHGNKTWFSTNQGFTSFDGTNWQVYSPLTVPEFQGMIVGGCVEFDSQGRLWTSASTFAAPGIVSYDGSTWTFYNNTNSNLPSSGTVHVDQQDNVWVRNGNWGLAVLQPSTSVSTVSGYRTLQAFPNPATESVRITGIDSKATISLFNAVNQSVAGWSRNGEELDVRNLPAGTYTIRATSTRGVTVARFWKAN